MTMFKNAVKEHEKLQRQVAGQDAILRAKAEMEDNIPMRRSARELHDMEAGLKLNMGGM